MWSVSSEQFMSVFEKEKVKYFLENEKQIKKEAFWKEKCLDDDKKRKHLKSINLENDDNESTVVDSSKKLKKESFSQDHDHTHSSLDVNIFSV